MEGKGTRGEKRARQTLRMLADAPMRSQSVRNVLGKSFKGPTNVEIKNLFKMIDANGDGVITRSELISAMQNIDQDEAVSTSIMKRSIYNLIEVADVDKDGSIDIDEFTQCVKNIVSDLAEDLKPKPPPAKPSPAKKSKGASAAPSAPAPAAVASGPGASGSSFGSGIVTPVAAVARKTPTMEFMEARTDVDLAGYKYGDEPEAGSSSGMLDIVFMLDCTGSMGSTIEACKQNTIELVNKLRSEDQQDVRFCLVPYRDHQKNRGNEYVTKVYPFTRDSDQILASLGQQRATGGCDGPEAVTAALYECLCIDWRPDATKLVISMADAGPHGMGGRSWGDDYPDGDPDGKDPVVIAKEMESLGITVYSLIVGSCNEKDQWFFGALSQRTGGIAMKMSDASFLADAIIAGAQESIAMERNIVTARTRIEKLEGEGGARLDDDQRTAAVEAALGEAMGDGASASLSIAVPQDKVVKVPPGRMGQAMEATSLLELATWWNGNDHDKPRFLARSSSAEAITARVARVVGARDARSTDKVVVECVAEGSKIRAKVVSDGYDGSKNVQFPRALRADGKKYLVDQVVDAGKFYRAKGNITPIEE